jgi:hypothetical protein
MPASYTLEVEVHFNVSGWDPSDAVHFMGIISASSPGTLDITFLSIW